MDGAQDPVAGLCSRAAALPGLEVSPRKTQPQCNACAQQPEHNSQHDGMKNCWTRGLLGYLLSQPTKVDVLSDLEEG